jgi:hypothetical protein
MRFAFRAPAFFGERLARDGFLAAFALVERLADFLGDFLVVAFFFVAISVAPRLRVPASLALSSPWVP